MLHVVTPGAGSLSSLAKALNMQSRRHHMARFAYPLMLIYRFIDPPISAMMLRNVFWAVASIRAGCDFQDISPNLARAVVISEDADSAVHAGVDWMRRRGARRSEDGDKPRGARTLPMQTAKNLFCGRGKHFRKALEVPLAYFMSFVGRNSGSSGVFNVAEWGPGITSRGRSPASFGVSADSLTRSEAHCCGRIAHSAQTQCRRHPRELQNIASRIEGCRPGAADAACIFDR